MTESISINYKTKVITTVEGGVRHHYHTDPEEAATFSFISRCLRAGCVELNQLVPGGSAPTAPREELKRRWVEKVSAAGMPREMAKEYLADRLGEEVA